MSRTVEVEIDDHELVDAIADDPELIIDGLRKLASYATVGSAERHTYEQAAKLLGGSLEDNEMADPAIWAEAFFKMDCIARDQALQELKRAVPHVRLP
jgi:hypothetical protein